MTIEKQGEIYIVYEDVHKIGTIEKVIEDWEFLPNLYTINYQELIQIADFINSL